MNKEKFDDLLDDYLKGNLGSHERKLLEKAIKDDPALAREMADSQKTFEILRRYRNGVIRNQLKKYDHQNRFPTAKGWRFLKKIIVIACLLFLCAAWIGGRLYFHSSNVAVRHLEKINFEKTSIQVDDETIAQWNIAMKYCLEKDYKNAALHFHSISANHLTNIHQFAKWNELMSHFAVSGKNEDWDKRYREFLATSDFYWKNKAYDFNEKVNSPFYRIFMFNRPPTLSALKPRLM